MTAEEYVKDCESSCGMAAEDCKNAADYVAYNFKHGFQDEARKYVKLLMDRVGRLNAELGSLDYAIKKQNLSERPKPSGDAITDRMRQNRQDQKLRELDAQKHLDAGTGSA